MSVMASCSCFSVKSLWVDISSRTFKPVRADLLVQLFSRLDYRIHPTRIRSVSECVGTIACGREGGIREVEWRRTGEVDGW
jgi:hypothetical protein